MNSNLYTNYCLEQPKWSDDEKIMKCSFKTEKVANGREIN